jgi:DNA-binding response OmpR family regulator
MSTLLPITSPVERPPRVLVVDDEPTLLEVVTFNLRREGYEVETAGDGLAALDKARTASPDLIVLDIMLPALDGFQVVRTLRAESVVPILVLSARGEEFDRVLGLELGADDYLTKPFAIRELLARVKSLLRRAQMPAARSDTPAEASAVGGRENGWPTKGEASRRLVVGNLVIDSARRQASLGGVALSLKPKEFDLLYYIARHPGIVLSRDALLREVWGYDYPVDTRTVDVHVSWLRQKIEEDPSQPRRIETVRGHGYRFVPEPV